MKLFIVTLCLATVYAGKLDNTYLPPGNARTAGGSSFLAAPKPFAPAPAAHAVPSGSGQPPIPIIKANSEVNVDGSFHYEYETANGISAHEIGSQKSSGSEEINDVHGAFSYTGDDGVQYSISYTADENGFVPQGAHIPTPPPVPEEILKALEANAADEARGIVDDGSYKAEGASQGAGQLYSAPKAAGGGHAGYRY